MHGLAWYEYVKQMVMFCQHMFLRDSLCEKECANSACCQNVLTYPEESDKGLIVTFAHIMIWYIMCVSTSELLSISVIFYADLLCLGCQFCFHFGLRILSYLPIVITLILHVAQASTMTFYRSPLSPIDGKWAIFNFVCSAVLLRRKVHINWT